VIAALVIAGDRLWCYGVGAVGWDESCAHRVLRDQPPLFDIAVVVIAFPLALWRARRRAQGLDSRWDWLRWDDDGGGDAMPDPSGDGM
jgi:hypothetical protein